MTPALRNFELPGIAPILPPEIPPVSQLQYPIGIHPVGIGLPYLLRRLVRHPPFQTLPPRRREVPPHDNDLDLLLVPSRLQSLVRLVDAREVCVRRLPFPRRRVRPDGDVGVAPPREMPIRALDFREVPGGGGRRAIEAQDRVRIISRRVRRRRRRGRLRRRRLRRRRSVGRCLDRRCRPVVVICRPRGEGSGVERSECEDEGR